MQSRVKKTKRQTISQRINEALNSFYEDLSGLDNILSVRREKAIDVVVAFSGGLDSMSLLYAVSKLKSTLKGRVIAVHVHHNLSKNANAWADFCEKQAEKLGVEFVLRRVSFSTKEEGIEAAARKARYRALEQVAQKEKCQAIITAHHADDQIETFLIQWIRGSGPEGLAGMPYFKESEKIIIARPFLSFERKDLEQFAKQKKLEWVEDESNDDTTYLRNAIRKEIVPKLDEIHPGFRRAALRSIELLGESVEILRECTEKDLDATLDEENKLNLEKFLSLPQTRQTRVLRMWLHEKGFRPLNRTRLLELLRQIKESRSASSVLLKDEGKELRKFSNTLLINEVQDVVQKRERVIVWEGQSSIDLPEFNGQLCFERSEKGFSEEYLRAKPLIVKARSGGEKIKIHPFRPSKHLKVLYQEAGIADFERPNLPLVWRDKTLIYAAGIGEEVREKLDDNEGPRYSIVFKKNATLF